VRLLRFVTHWQRLYFFAGLIWLIDFSTKIWALNNLSEVTATKVFGSFLQLRLLFNPGAAFSLGTNFTFIFTILAVLAVAAVAYVAPRIQSKSWSILFGLALGGILGNLTDRIFREPSFFNGHVIDWIELPNWPVFNVADMAISCAAVLSVILIARNIEPFQSADQSNGDSSTGPSKPVN
jgi:signal peptidase II